MTDLTIQQLLKLFLILMLIKAILHQVQTIIIGMQKDLFRMEIIYLYFLKIG